MLITRTYLIESIFNSTTKENEKDLDGDKKKGRKRKLAADDNKQFGKKIDNKAKKY
jgi:hypothetical protein